MTTNWRPGNTAPKDGTSIRLRWHNGNEDVGEWRVWKEPELVWANHPDLHGRPGEWSTEFGNADSGELEPEAWAPLEADA